MSLEAMIAEWKAKDTDRKSRKITCADLTKNHNCDAALEGLKTVRCIDVPVNVCRMKPIDAKTGKPLKRKFVVLKEGVTAEWWKEVK
jgi:hypothetical protein